MTLVLAECRDSQGLVKCGLVELRGSQVSVLTITDVKSSSLCEIYCFHCPICLTLTAKSDTEAVDILKTLDDIPEWSFSIDISRALNLGHTPEDLAVEIIKYLDKRSDPLEILIPMLQDYCRSSEYGADGPLVGDRSDNPWYSAEAVHQRVPWFDRFEPLFEPRFGPR